MGLCLGFARFFVFHRVPDLSFSFLAFVTVRALRVQRVDTLNPYEFFSTTKSPPTHTQVPKLWAELLDRGSQAKSKLLAVVPVSSRSNHRVNSERQLFMSLNAAPASCLEGAC